MDSYPPQAILSTQSLYNHLQQVSRSFAITIPFMDAPLKDYVSLAYLLCRIVDTVEDDASAPLEEKVTWLSDFAILASDEFKDTDVLVRLQERALELIKDGSAPQDIALMHDLIASIGLLKTYPDEIQEFISHCVSILSFGMASSLRKNMEHEAIANLDELDNYCYFVAGVVGEMLAELFAFTDTSVDKRELLELAVSFGEGLQLTNILRDRCKDAERGVSFLPASDEDEVLEYVAITQGHLDDAVSFICQLSPKASKGVRMFCFTNVAMAMYLLRQVARKPLDPVCNYKISRKKTKLLFSLCKLACASNFGIRSLSFVLSLGMKRHRRDVRELRDKVSIWDHSSSTN